MTVARCPDCGADVSVAPAVVALLRTRERASSAELAEALGEDPGCIRVALSRMRARGVVEIAERGGARRRLIYWRLAAVAAE